MCMCMKISQGYGISVICQDVIRGSQLMNIVKNPVPRINYAFVNALQKYFKHITH